MSNPNGGDGAAIGTRDVVQTSIERPILALVLLCMVNFINVIDGKVIGILAEPIKLEMQLTDTQVGMLTGFVFSICYAISAVPIARLSDTGDRVRILSYALVFWSTMTVLCGLAGSYAKLAFARMGVAVGESACSPASYALIADYFGPSSRARAMSAITVATSAGTLVAFMVGGPLAQAFGWRIVFLSLGLPGILLALALWRWLPEPRRKSALTDVSPTTSFGTFHAISKLLRTPGYALLVAGASALTFTTAALLVWAAAFFQRVYGWTVGETGVVLGLTFGITGIIAPVLTAVLGDRRSSNDSSAYVRVIATMTVLAIPAVIAGLLVSNAAASLVLLGLAFALIGGWPPNILATIRILAGGRNMALATALLGLALNLLGIGLGPLVIGMVADGLHPAFGTNALRYALQACAVALIIATLCLWRAAVIVQRNEPDAI